MTKKEEMFGGTIRFKELMETTYSRINFLGTTTNAMMVNAIKALKEDSEEAYNQLKEEFLKVKEGRVSLEASVVNSIALHHPFATDLRFLISSLKIANEIERTARDAVHVAHSTIFFDRSMSCLNDSMDKIVELAEKAHEMFNESFQAFMARKIVESALWTQRDSTIDSIQEELIENISKILKDECSATRAGISLVLTTRYIERIADHACNIAEESNYVVTSKRVPID